MKISNFLTQNTVAEILGVPKRTLQHWAQHDKIGREKYAIIEAHDLKYIFEAWNSDFVFTSVDRLSIMIESKTPLYSVFVANRMTSANKVSVDGKHSVNDVICDDTLVITIIGNDFAQTFGTESIKLYLEMRKK